MSRAAALLLIFALFICPLRCMGGVGDATAALAGCSCPSHCTDCSPACPCEGGQSCNCGNCLCNGAVLTESSRDAETHSTSAALSAPMRTAIAPPQLSVRPLRAAPLHSPTGRERRVLLRSLVI